MVHHYLLVTQVTIAPANARGDLIVSCNIAESDDTRNRCQVIFVTNYPEISRFQSELETMMNRQRTQAVLSGRDFGSSKE